MFAPWKIEYEGTSYTFSGPNSPVEVVSWEQSADVYDVDDARAPRSDGLYFGRDFVEPGEITVTVKIDFTDAPYPVDECVRRAMQARADLARAWRADTVRATPGAVAELTIGGLLLVEGRPRRIVFDDSQQQVGLIFAELPFVPAHHGAYDAVAGWQQVVLNLASAPIGGLRSPLRSPLRTAVETVQVKPVVVAGESPVRPVIEIKGPVQAGAQLERPGKWRLYLNRGLTASQTVRIDTRAGRAVTFLNNKPVQVLDPRSSMLADCVLQPGSNVVSLRGVSFDGTVRVTVRWRDVKEAF